MYHLGNWTLLEESAVAVHYANWMDIFYSAIRMVFLSDVVYSSVEV